MIIVEGADNTGKTTLVRQLREMDPTLELLRREKFRPTRGESIGSSYLKMLAKPQGVPLAEHLHSIADRCLASECIYGPLFRDCCRMSDAEHLQIVGLLMRYNAIIIWCDPPDAAIIDSWKARPQLYDRDPLLISRAYRDRMESIFHPLSVTRYDWTRPDAWLSRQSFLQWHNTYKWSASQFHPHHP